jgi:predicted AlkP superfamily pyrophosphatase or phosphodiesterase
MPPSTHSRRSRAPSRLRRVAAAFVALASWMGCAAAGSARGATVAAGGEEAPTATAAAARPRLVVLVVVDQFRADYLDGFAAQLQGGLARLAREGAWFSNARHDHGLTETAPGHATLLSGRFPRSTGIVANWVGVDDDSAPLVGGVPGPGASPRRFQGTTLVDWMRAADGRSRALSISGKDRGAILPIGRSRASVFWVANDGELTTSSYYAPDLPQWVLRVNAREELRHLAGSAWTLLLPASAYPEPDTVVFENNGVDVVFPHAIPADSEHAAVYARATPALDRLVLGAALEGVQAMALGAGGSTDLLSLSLSATDLIGHRFGPDSREIHDQVIQLDRMLGSFLDSLFQLRDPREVVVVLTSDHGIGSMPELAPAGVEPRPVRAPTRHAVRAVQEGLQRAGVDPDLVAIDGPFVLMAHDRLRRAKVNVDSLSRALATALRATPGVLRVDRLRDLPRDSARDSIARRWTHQLPGGAGVVELVVTFTPLTIEESHLPATHGMPFDDDVRVPMIFWGAPFHRARHDAPVRTVDLAPTLARVLGIRPGAGERIDGVVLREAFALDNAGARP